MCGIELLDVCVSDAVLFFVAIEDDRPIGRAYVITLAVELRGIVGYGEEDAAAGHR